MADNLRAKPIDPYFKKNVTLRLGRMRLEFAVSQELFSSHEIDRGTRLLLRSLSDVDLPTSARVLDVGCGYGPLGVGLKALEPSRTLHMVDRDALAVAFGQRNAVANGFDDAVTYGSLGFDDLPAEPFDLIVANVPGKGSRPLYEHLLLDARSRLSAHGLVAIVVVAPLALLLGEILEGAGSSVEVLHHETTADYAVFHYRIVAPLGADELPLGGFDRDIYRRASGSFEHGGTRYSLQAMHSLPEFDTLSFHTRLALDIVDGLAPATLLNVTVWNPGQGHVPAYLARRAPHVQLRLLDRDLLALRASRLNATANGLDPDHVEVRHAMQQEADAADDDDLVVDLLRPKEPASAVQARAEQVVGGLRPGGVLVVAGRSTSVTRYVTALQQRSAPVAVVRRERAQGCTVAELRKAPTTPG